MSTPACKKVRNCRQRIWGDGIQNAEEQGQSGAQQEAEVLRESEAEGRCEDLKQGEEAEVGRSGKDLRWQQGGGNILGCERGWFCDRRN